MFVKLDVSFCVILVKNIRKRSYNKVTERTSTYIRELFSQEFRNLVRMCHYLPGISSLLPLNGHRCGSPKTN